MKYEMIKVEANFLFTEASFIAPNGDDYRRVIEDMAAKGWMYNGWIPVGQNGRGQIMAMDLVFERED